MQKSKSATNLNTEMTKPLLLETSANPGALAAPREIPPIMDFAFICLQPLFDGMGLTLLTRA